MKIFPIYEGLILLDNEDGSRVIEYLEDGNFHIQYTPSGSYVVRLYNKKGESISLANFILNTNELVDHKDRNPFNNQKSNLRFCNKSQNNANSGPRNGREYKGITYVKKLGKWKATIMVNRKQKHIGCYSTSDLAALAYDEAAIKYFGEFAYLNFSNDVVKENQLEKGK